MKAVTKNVEKNRGISLLSRISLIDYLVKVVAAADRVKPAV